MCSRWATSLRDRPWCSRPSASNAPSGGVSSRVSLSAAWSMGLALLRELLRLARVGIAAAQLLHVAVLARGVAARARDLHAEHQALEVRLREAHVAIHVVGRVLVGAPLVREHREVVERADQL